MMFYYCSFLLLAQKKGTKEKGSLKNVNQFPKKNCVAIIALRRIEIEYPLTRKSVSTFGFQMASDYFGIKQLF
jgi:hypothetical protein